MAPIRRVTAVTVAVLDALLAADGDVWGLSLSRTVNRAPGSIYPILTRLEADGWLSARWEDGDPGRPRRRLYRLTEEGSREARAVSAAFHARTARPGPAPEPRFS